MPFAPQNLAYAVREVEGIGFRLRPDPKSEMAQILIVFPQSPAGKAGLTSNLLIQEINGIAVAGKTGPECVELMAGPIGTRIDLKLFNPTDNAVSSLNLKKEKFLTVMGSKRDR